MGTPGAEVSRLLGSLSEVASSLSGASGLRSWALGYLGEILPFDSAIYLAEPSVAEAPATINKAEFVHLISRFAVERARFLPGMQKHAQALAAAGLYLDTELYSGAERRNLPFYAEIVRPQRITNQLAARVSFGGHQIGSFYLCRNGRIAPFRARDLDALRPMLPALGLAQSAFAWSSLRRSDGQLTARELEIARLVARGLQNREIAAILGTSPFTVRNQLYQVFARLGLSSRAELAVWATQSDVA